MLLLLLCPPPCRRGVVLLSVKLGGGIPVAKSSTGWLPMFSVLGALSWLSAWLGGGVPVAKSLAADVQVSWRSFGGVLVVADVFCPVLCFGGAILAVHVLSLLPGAAL
jgi:hypothetical protein